MLAYVFWHWRDARVGQSEYRERVVTFQRALNEQRVDGMCGSMVLQLAGVPWVDVPEEVYEE